MLTNSLGDCASLIISVTAVMSSYTEPILTINGNLIPTVIFVTHVWELKTFPDEWMWEWYCWLMLLKCTFRGFCHVVHKWCCVIIVDLTSFFPSKEFLSVLESLRIAMKASWKLTKIIKGSIISPLSASLGWNCVNLLVFCRRGKWLWMPSKYATRDLMLSPLIGHTPHARLLIGPGLGPPCPWYGWPRHDDTGTWHSASQTCHNTSRSATWYKYDGLLMWPIIICSHVMISGGSEISSAGYEHCINLWMIQDPRDWMEIMKVMRLWDAYHQDLIGLQSANQSLNYGHQMTNEPVTKWDCLCSS